MAVIRLVATSFLIILLSLGCAAGPKLVLRPLTVDRIEYDTVVVGEFAIPEEEANPDLNQEQQAKLEYDKAEATEAFRTLLTERIVRDKRFKQVLDIHTAQGAAMVAEALLIEGTLVKFNPGNRAARYIVGFGAGTASFEVECVFKDQKMGAELYRARYESKLAGGFFGGNKKDSVRGCVDGITKELKKLKKK